MRTQDQRSDLVETIIDALPQRNRPWQEPIAFDLGKEADREKFVMMSVGYVLTQHNPIEQVAHDYFDHKHPDLTSNDNARKQFVTGIIDQGAAYGNWFLYPGTNELFHYAPQTVHEELLSSRNNPLISPDEQTKLRRSFWAIFGESVGSHIIMSGLHSASFGRIAHGDPDQVSLPNLNRMGLTYGSVGQTKIDENSMLISQTNPYIRQDRFVNGYDQSAKEALLNDQDKPNVVFDAVDNLATKASLRITAREIGAPLVMVTDLGVKSIVDVERYDLGDKKAVPFGGRLKAKDVNHLAAGSLSLKEQSKLITKVTGVRHASPRLLMAAAERGHTLAGFPQLGTVAEVGGAVGTIVAQEIVLGRKLPSGRYVVSVRDALKLSSMDTFQKKLDMLRHFIRWQVDLRKS